MTTDAPIPEDPDMAETPEVAAEEETVEKIPDDVLPLVEAAEVYAAARCKLPAPGKEFHGPDDAKRFQAYFVALLAFERAAMAFAGKKIHQ